MPMPEKDTGPKTTIWRAGPGGEKLLTTVPGLPFRAPKIGTPVHIPSFGQATCSGIQLAGSGADETVVEARFTLVDVSR